MKTRYDFHKLVRLDAGQQALINLVRDVIEAERDEAASTAYMHGAQDGVELAECEQDRARRRG